MIPDRHDFHLKAGDRQYQFQPLRRRSHAWQFRPGVVCRHTHGFDSQQLIHRSRGAVGLQGQVADFVGLAVELLGALADPLQAVTVGTGIIASVALASIDGKPTASDEIALVVEARDRLGA